MNLRLAILVASLVANVTLATFIVIRRPPASGSSQELAAPGSDAPSSASKLASSGTDSPASGDRVEPAEGVHGFRWSQLESEDYKVYIAHLREFGVPEKVVRDIIIADVQKL